MIEGFEGWDDYAPFYDWENARTLGRRDVPFWRNLAIQAAGRVLELGWVKPGDRIGITAGLPSGRPGTTSLLQIQQV